MALCYIEIKVEAGYGEKIDIDLYKNDSFLERKSINIKYTKTYYWYRVFLQKGNYSLKVYDVNDRQQAEKSFKVTL